MINRFLKIFLACAFFFVNLQANAVLPEERFKVFWLEPHTLNQGVTGRVRAPDKEDLNRIFARFSEMGVTTVVIAYSELLDYYFYEPSQLLKNNYPRSSVTVHTLSDGTKFFDGIFYAAENNNVDIIVGLSQFGDGEVISRITGQMRGSQASGMNDFDSIVSASNLAELNKQKLLGQIMGADIYNKYGQSPSFKGWYLAQEPHCLDVAMKLFGPIANFLKGIDSSKKIMISPNADAEVCFAPKVYDQGQLISNLHNQLNSMKQNNIDIIAYQDSLGAGFQAGMLQFNSFAGGYAGLLSNYLLPNLSHYHYSDLARTMRLNYLRYIIFPGIKLAHAGTGVEFWINTELWRMDGYCPPIFPARYGCNYAGLDENDQLTTWYNFINPDQLMLNESMMQFDFPEANISLTNTGILQGKYARQVARAFTNYYLNRLGLPVITYDPYVPPE